MGRYFDFEDTASCFDFLNELVTAVLFTIGGIYFTIRLVRNLRHLNLIMSIEMI